MLYLDRNHASQHSHAAGERGGQGICQWERAAATSRRKPEHSHRHWHWSWGPAVSHPLVHFCWSHPWMIDGVYVKLVLGWHHAIRTSSRSNNAATHFWGTLKLGRNSKSSLCLVWVPFGTSALRLPVDPTLWRTSHCSSHCSLMGEPHVHACGGDWISTLGRPSSWCFEWPTPRSLI